MRLCALIDAWEPVWGGGQTHVWEISKCLVDDYKYEVDIFTRNLTENNRKYPASQSKTHPNIRIFRIGPPTAFFDLFGRLAWMFTAFFSVWKEHRKKPYAFIHAHAFISGIPGKALGFILGVPVVFTVHGSHNMDLKKRNVTAHIEKFILTCIPYDRLISVSQSFLRYKNINSNIVVIPNGVSLKEFDKVRGKKSSGSFKLLWVGRLDQFKGLDILLHALARILKMEKSVYLELVGSGPEKSKLVKLIDTLDIKRKVGFTPKTSLAKLTKIYKTADVFVLPSLAEGQPVTLLEAWAAKLPVIVTDVGDNKYFIKDHSNGYLVKSGDSYALEKAISESKNNPKLRFMGLNGYRLVKSKYSWNMAAQKYHHIYQSFTK